MNAILIELSDKTVFVARLEPQTASEDPLTDKDKVILDLYRRLEALQQANKAKTSNESVACSHIIHEPDAAKGNYHCGKCGEPMEA